MITDSFLNLCCASLTDDNPKFTDTVVSDVYDILNFFKQKEDNIPLQFRSKYVLSHTLASLRKEGRNIEESMDVIHASSHFKDLEDYIHSLSKPETKIPDTKIESGLKRLKTIKKFVLLLRDLPNIENFIEQFNTNSFTNLDDAITDYDLLVSKMYSRISEEKRSEASTAIKTLDMFSDSYEAVLNQIELSYSGQNSITTGYSELDLYMNGGFERSRLYIFGGASGDGKSALILNFLRNAAERKKNPSCTKKEIFVYITLENLVDETFLRLYCSHKTRKINQVVEYIKSEKEVIEGSMKKWQNDNNSIIVMAYFPATITSVADVMVYIDEIKNRYKDTAEVKAVYLDYLDLLMAGQKFDLHRLEMGQITIDLKVMAVRMQIPIVTVTQVNRSIFLLSRINIKDRGYIAIKDVKVGDEVEGSNGFRKVLQIFPIEHKKCYRIKTKSGKEIICGPKHNFPTTTGLKNIEYTGLSVGDKLLVKE